MSQIGTMTTGAGVVTSLNLAFCPQYLIIDNENGYLTLIFQTKNWKNCYRKNDDLYYVVSNNCISLLELPDDSYYLNSLKYSLIPYKGFNNRGFNNRGFNNRGSIRIVKKL